MHPFWFLLNMYLVVEGINYVEYLMQKQKLEKFSMKIKKRKSSIDKSKKYTKKIKDDIKNHIKSPQNYLENLFDGRIRSYCKYGVYESLKQCFYYPFHRKIKSCETIEDMINFYEQSNGVKLQDTKNNCIKKVNWYKNELKSWYKPLPVICMFEAVLTYSDVLMEKEGFRRTNIKNGLTIWFREGEKNKFDSILFVHAGAGGLLMQSSFISKLPKDKSIIVPEIPGISFGGRVTLPPTIRKISKSLTKFIKKRDIKTIQMISHSFGGNILACIINNQHNYLEKNNIQITNTILVEPVIFIPTLPFIHKLLNDDITVSDVIQQLKNNQGRLLSYVLLFRDIYTQFYAQRCFLITDSLVGETKYEKNNMINIVFSENDEFSPITECVHYLESKKYNGNIKVFEGRSHGDFCFDLDMQNYVLNLIK